MPVTKLAAGTRNVVIPSGEKVEVRGGMDYLGVPGEVGVNTDEYWVIANRIHSSYDPFVNSAGWTIPLRVFYSGTVAQGDVIEAWLPVFLGGTDMGTKKWYQVTENAPSQALISTHRYYWAEQFDTANLTSRLIFTRGETSVGSWSGGAANIVGMGATNLDVASGKTWAQYGFVDAPEGISTIVINGVSYAVTSTFNSNSISIASTAGISIDDVAFQITQQDVPASSTVVLDVCTAILNQVYYFSWTSRNYFVSWNRNQTQSITVPSAIVSSGLNDALFSGTYTGTINHNFTVTIDSVNPNIDTQDFSGTGTQSVKFDTSGFTGTAGTEYIYQVAITSIYDMTLNGVNVIDFATGDVVIGLTSGATATVVSAQGNSGPTSFQQVISLGNINGSFSTGETIHTLGSTATGTMIRFENISRYSLYKNQTLVASNSILTNGGIGSDGLALVVGSNTDQQPGDLYTLTILINGQDTFSWAIDGVTQGSKIPITLSAQALTDGISVTFGNKTGHAIGDAWTITAFPTVTKSWIQFWYSAPSRFPGEGYTGLLDSNGWTAQPQEKTIYAVDQAGHYYELGTQLSANLLNETVITNRLKSEPRNKPLFPYLINYIQNQFSIISQDKTFDVLGRIKLLELPQIRSISDEVRTDFVNSNWQDGDIKYFGRRQYFSVPNDGNLFVHDQFMNYWQAPNTFGRRIGLLAIIDGNLCAHSYERNETYQLYTNSLNDLGEFPIDTKIIFPYDGGKARFSYKGIAAIGFMGYMLSKPKISWKINTSVGGSSDTDMQRQGFIQPWVTKRGVGVPADLSSLGKSSLGYHGLGNSPVTPPSPFMYIKPFNNVGYYLRNIEIACQDLEQNWSLTALGTDLSDPSISNDDIVDTNPLV